MYANRLKELRKNKRLLQRQMADFLGITERHYRYCEAGKIDMPASKLIKLADFFEVSIDYLLLRSDEPGRR